MNILFEPWALGDTVIAASMFKYIPTPEKKNWQIACQPLWWPTLKDLFSLSDENFLELTLPWTRRSKSYSLRRLPRYPQATRVYSIRGDLRDAAAAMCVFPLSSLRYTGFLDYFRERLLLLDLLLSPLCPPQNKYQRWHQLLFKRPLSILPKSIGTPREVIIHIGSSFRSRRYPSFDELRSCFESAGIRARVVASSAKDLANLGESHKKAIPLITGPELIQAFKSVDLVVCNDSAPLHIAAACGVATVGLFEISNARLWCPPEAQFISHFPHIHRCRRDDRAFQEVTVDTWPSAPAIFQKY